MEDSNLKGTEVKEEVKNLNFIEEIIEDDLKTGKHKSILTRFPPEPNGYLHIGHAKSICLNFGVAKKYGGKTNLRFDDTNPTKEDVEYVDSIKNDIRWLGFQWAEERYASDYFQQLYDWAELLIHTDSFDEKCDWSKLTEEDLSSDEGKWLDDEVSRAVESVRLDARGVQRALAARLQRQWIENPSALGGISDPGELADALRTKSLKLVSEATGAEVLP